MRYWCPCPFQSVVQLGGFAPGAVLCRRAVSPHSPWASRKLTPGQAHNNTNSTPLIFLYQKYISPSIPRTRTENIEIGNLYFRQTHRSRARFKTTPLCQWFLNHDCCHEDCLVKDTVWYIAIYYRFKPSNDFISEVKVEPWPRASQLGQTPWITPRKLAVIPCDSELISLREYVLQGEQRSVSVQLWGLGGITLYNLPPIPVFLLFPWRVYAYIKRWFQSLSGHVFPQSKGHGLNPDESSWDRDLLSARGRLGTFW